MVPRLRGLRTNLADGGLQHGVQAPLGRVHVAGDALTLDDARELAHVPRHAQDVVEAVGRATADVVVTGGTRTHVEDEKNKNKNKKTFSPLAPLALFRDVSTCRGC